MNRDELRAEIDRLRKQIQQNETLQLERQRRQQAEFKQKYLALFDIFIEPVFIYDSLTYKFLYCNEAALKFYGYPREEILTMTPFDLHHPDQFEKVREDIEKRTDSEPKQYTHFTRDRRERFVKVNRGEIYFDGEPAWLSIIHDITELKAMGEELGQYKDKLEEMLNERTIEVLITNKKLKQEILERKKAEQGILESEKKFRTIIEKFFDGVVLVNEKGSIVEWNQAQEEIFGEKREMVIGKKIWEVQFRHLPEEERQIDNYTKIQGQWEQFLVSGKNPFRDNLSVAAIQRVDGQLRSVQQLFFAIDTEQGMLVAATTRDITEQQVLEKQLMQAQKMEAVGTMAGGIAHDFNNILSGIIGYTDLAIRKTAKDAPTQKYLSQVLTASRRATDLVKQILTFSRPDIKALEPLRLSSVVEEALKLLRSTTPTTIEIVSNIKAENSFILADPTQLHQVIMNLCTNAAHAMNDRGGILELSLNEEEVDGSLYKDLESGPHLRLNVSDTGYGIKKEVVEKIFDPFFTTKKKGEGTGMGLAVVHRIIERHKGNISVYSKEGEGTIFSILLPVVEDVILNEEHTEEEIVGGTERIMLVEDDLALMEAEKSLLEDLGYNVSAFGSGVQALEIFKKVPDRFDFVITDFTMPRMTGVQLTRKIRSIRPNIPVLLCTGYSNVITPQRAKLLGIGEVVMKPIELHRIARSIRRLLELEGAPVPAQKDKIELENPSKSA